MRLLTGTRRHLCRVNPGGKRSWTTEQGKTEKTIDRRRQVGLHHGRLADLQLNLEYVDNRAEWRKRTRVADPSQERHVCDAYFLLHLIFSVFSSIINIQKSPLFTFFKLTCSKNIAFRFMVIGYMRAFVLCRICQK